LQDNNLIIGTVDYVESTRYANADLRALHSQPGGELLFGLVICSPQCRYQSCSRLLIVLVAGIDVSGNPYAGNYKFMGIVIGTEEKIQATVKKTGFGMPHMNRIKSRKAQKRIVSEMNFDGKESIAFCVLLDRNAVIEQTKQKGSTQYHTKMKIYRVYNRTLMVSD